ncbi:MAG TPA: peptidylprolyl isomerase [Candidatus Paceibacterota bacterium]|nr:peptidylprolyl isomerase [Candidatus Paceibacterota bacterium]
MQRGNALWIPLLIVAALALVGTFVYLKSRSEAPLPNTPIVTTPEENTPGAASASDAFASVALFKTSMGEIEVELLGAKAPLTVQNFVKLAQQGFYDGTRFHRVIKDFMIQGGDPLSKDTANRGGWGTGGPGYTFPDEINDVKLVEGVLAMANSGPNTNGSQFFIVATSSTPWLDGKHTAFGRVSKGMDVVNRIEAARTNQLDQPLQDVIVESVTIR